MKLIAAMVLIVAAASAFASQDPPALSADAPADPDVIALVGRRSAEVKARPRDPEARRILAMTFHANGFTEFAAQTYKQTIALDPSCARCWNNLAVIEADEHMNLSAAIIASDRAIALDARHVPIRVRRGNWLLDLGRADDAQIAFAGALEIDPANIAAQVGLARVMLRRGDAEAVLSQLETIARANPNAGNDPAFRLALGTAYGRLGRSEHSRAVLAGVGQSPPSISDPWLDEILAHRAGYRALMTDAASLLAAGQFDRALQSLERVRRSRPHDNDATVLTAQARMAKGDLAGAKSTLDELLAREPRSYDGTAVLASLMIALGDANAALTLAERAAAIDPGRSQAWALLGHLHASGGRLPQAADALGKAIHCGTSDAGVWVIRGRVLLQMRDYAGAARVFEQMTFAHPFMGAPYVGLARAIAETGQIDRAAQLLDRGRQLDPNDPLINETAQRIAMLKGGSR